MNFIDELATAPNNVVHSVMQTQECPLFDHVDQMVEYELFRRKSRPDLTPLHMYRGSLFIEQLFESLSGQCNPNLSLQPIDSDVTAIPPKLGAIPSWVAFLKRAELTARSMGLAELVAAGLAGAIEEMADNVVRHSEDAGSGVVAFARNANGFEYVVGDSGIGILASLRKAQEFRSLRDDLEALPLAITPGVSRFGRGHGFGYGFRAVFLPLRVAAGKVRLRSGQAVLEVEGIGPRPDQGRCAQRPLQQGVVVSVALVV